MSSDTPSSRIAAGGPEGGSPGTVHLVDDEEPVRDAIAFLLGSRGLEVHCYASGPEFLEKAQPGSLRGAVLLDVRMEPMSGLLVHDALTARGVRNPVLFLTGHGDIPMAVEALKKGAFDFIEKPYIDNALAQRVEQALRVEAAMTQRNAGEAERQARLASLTEREREVMQRVAAGRLNKVIADELCVSVRTVEVHRARVFSKLGVRSAAELATYLSARG